MHDTATPEPVFVNVYGAPESIPTTDSASLSGGPVRQIGLWYWTARLVIDFWAP
jgi:hypothetical protein